MSFSSEIKEELSKINNLKDKQAVYYELIGYLITKNTKIEEKDIKALLRGAFLGAGFISEPNNTYHLEINFSKLENLLLVKDLLEKYQIVPKILNRNGSISLYIKEGEDISKLLVYIGASNAMLKFEEIRVIKEARNNVNRMVNCEVANLNKTVNAASRQIEAIRKIKNSRKFTNLPEELKEIAELRIKNPDASLIELGNLLKNPIGKSGVNYRLNKLINIAKEL